MARGGSISRSAQCARRLAVTDTRYLCRCREFKGSQEDGSAGYQLAMEEQERENDPLVSVLPIHLSNALAPNLQIHQFPLLTRPLQVPPSAAQSGKKIRAKIKPKSSRIEVHVPVDLRPEVWNKERGQALGQARVEDDQEHSLDSKKPDEDVDPRLTEVRMRSERIQHRGVYMLGIVRDGMVSFLLNYTG